MTGFSPARKQWSKNDSISLDKQDYKRTPYLKWKFQTRFKGEKPSLLGGQSYQHHLLINTKLLRTADNAQYAYHFDEKIGKEVLGTLCTGSRQIEEFLFVEDLLKGLPQIYHQIDQTLVLPAKFKAAYEKKVRRQKGDEWHIGFWLCTNFPELWELISGAAWLGVSVIFCFDDHHYKLVRDRKKQDGEREREWCGLWLIQDLDSLMFFMHNKSQKIGSIVLISWIPMIQTLQNKICCMNLKSISETGFYTKLMKN